MLSLFRNQQIFSLPLLLAYCIAIKIGYLFFPYNADLSYQKFFGFISSTLENQQINFFISVLLIFVQAIYFNITIAKIKILDEKSLGPAMVYCTVTTAFTAFNYIDMPIFVNFGLLYLLDQLVSYQNSEYKMGRFFNIGFISGLLTLAHPAFIVLLLISLICLLAIKPILFKELILFLLAFIAPFYFYIGISFITNHFSTIDIHAHFSQFKFAKIPLNQPRVIVIGCISLALIFYGFIQNQNLSRFTSVKIKRTMEWFFVFSLGLTFITIFSNSADLSVLMYLSIPFSFYLSLFFYRLKRNYLAEFIHFVFLGTILVFEYLPR